MITYQEVYDILRKEKYNEALQGLPENFLPELASYLEEKKQVLDKQGNNLFSDTIKATRKQLDNTISIIKEIFSIRNKKILNLAFTAALTGVSKRDTDSLLDYEKKLFELTVAQLEENNKKILQYLDGNFEKKKDLKNLFIRFKQEVPSFLLPESGEIGPFRAGDIANLPKEVAEILIADGKAVEIDAEN
jgi:DNA replication initiation complex subunit (GINS family)